MREDYQQIASSSNDGGNKDAAENASVSGKVMIVEPVVSLLGVDGANGYEKDSKNEDGQCDD